MTEMIFIPSRLDVLPIANVKGVCKVKHVPQIELTHVTVTMVVMVQVHVHVCNMVLSQIPSLYL